ncbi:hypothetical protein LNV23_19080 [Paucibacter sp. DJ1R-11]|uniref:hypothetical protein n=1 Tax=Paucibacter sp. DJ1R-11 TaxID=2893556 RepID=UPI0021E3E31E|nr:hypothetical protein [Paucibacter sp. DJ1R-11]MCV2365558.1 hypothetical protein [Paucibacter sp. DJ1R-11]
MSHDAKPPRNFWTPEGIALLRANYATQDTAELAKRLGRPVHQVQLKASRLGLTRPVANHLPRSGRPAHARTEVLAALAAAGPLGVMLRDLHAAVANRTEGSVDNTLYTAVLQEQAFALKLGRFSRYYATAAWRDTASAALQADHPAGISKPGTLRATVHGMVHAKGRLGASLDELDRALPGVARAKINLVANRLCALTMLHPYGAGPNKRMFSQAAWLEAHTQAEQQAGRVAPSCAPQQTRAGTASSTQRTLRAAAKRGAALPGARQIELAAKRTRAKGRLPTDTPWVPPTTEQPKPGTKPPQVAVQKVECKFRYRHEVPASNDAGAGLAAAGIGRYVEPASSWVEAVAERRAA